jgi:signal transduction histidine kinase
VKNFSELSLELLPELSEAMQRAQASTKREELDTLFNELKQNISKVCEHEQRASGIINGMLRHARNNRGEPQPTSINALVEEAIRLVQQGLRARSPPRHVSVDISFEEALPPLRLVPEDFRRVILNLLENGCYAAHEKARRPEAVEPPRLKVSTRWTGSEVEIRVRDNGNGVPAAVRDKLFTPFFTTKPAGEGTGLGLSLSHDIIVVALGGKLRVESEEGRYAEFTIVLPGELARPSA